MPEPVTPDRVRQVADLLAYAAACDPRLNTPDLQQAQARVLAWCDMLTDVPADFIHQRIRAYYQTDQQWPISAGSIRDRWLRQQAKVSQAALIAHTGTPVADLPPEIQEALSQARQQIRDNRAAMGWT